MDDRKFEALIEYIEEVMQDGVQRGWLMAIHNEPGEEPQYLMTQKGHAAYASGEMDAVVAQFVSAEFCG